MALESGVTTQEDHSPAAEQIRSELANLGTESSPKEIVDRFVLLENNSKFNNDSRMICEGFKNVFNAIKKTLDLTDRLTEKQEQEGELSAFMHDVGKSGGAEADVAGQMAVIKLYSIEGVENPFRQTVSEIVNEFFTNEAEEMMKNLAQSGVSGDMTMRAFYDQHAYWTRDILEKYPETFSKRTRVVAASHHIDRDINPYNLADIDIPMESLLIGALEDYVDILEEKILRAIDKYQAAISRKHYPGESTHEKGMDFIKGMFSEKYANDPMMNLILNTIDDLGQKGALFPTTQSKYLSLRNELERKPIIPKAKAA